MRKRTLWFGLAGVVLVLLLVLFGLALVSSFRDGQTDRYRASTELVAAFDVGRFPSLLSEAESGDCRALEIAGGVRHVPPSGQSFLTRRFATPDPVKVSTRSQIIG